MVPQAPAKWWSNRAVAAGLYPCVNSDATVVRWCRGMGGVGWAGLVCFGMGILWKDAVTGGLSILGGAEYCCVRA